MGSNQYKLASVVTRPRSDVTTIYESLFLDLIEVVTRPRSDVTTI